jgi:hypothetical protein
MFLESIVGHWRPLAGIAPAAICGRQLLLGHTRIESTVRHLGIEVDDAPAIAKQIDMRKSDWASSSAIEVGPSAPATDRLGLF